MKKILCSNELPHRNEPSTQIKLPTELTSYYKVSLLALMTIHSVYLYSMCHRKPFGQFTRCFTSPWKYLCGFPFLHSLSFCICLHLRSEISVHHLFQIIKKIKAFFPPFKIQQLQLQEKMCFMFTCCILLPHEQPLDHHICHEEWNKSRTTEHCEL